MTDSQRAAITNRQLLVEGVQRLRQANAGHEAERLAATIDDLDAIGYFNTGEFISCRLSESLTRAVAKEATLGVNLPELIQAGIDAKKSKRDTISDLLDDVRLRGGNVSNATASCYQGDGDAVYRELHATYRSESQLGEVGEEYEIVFTLVSYDVAKYQAVYAVNACEESSDRPPLRTSDLMAVC